MLPNVNAKVKVRDDMSVGLFACMSTALCVGMGHRAIPSLGVCTYNNGLEKSRKILSTEMYHEHEARGPAPLGRAQAESGKELPHPGLDAGHARRWSCSKQRYIRLHTA